MLKCANCGKEIWIEIWTAPVNITISGRKHLAVDRSHIADLSEYGYFLCKQCVGDQWFGKGEEKKS